MTFIYKLDLKILKFYRIPKTNFLAQGFQKLQNYKRTDAIERVTTPHSLGGG